jgi:hypothetical protein
MGFSYSEIWDDAVRLLKANAALLAAIAGVFLLLPDLLIAHFFPQPRAEDPAQMGRLMLAWFRDNSGVLMLGTLINAVGALAMLLLLLDPRRPTVGGAIAAVPPLILSFFVASILSNLMIVGGMFLLIVPGLYLIGRLSPVGAAIAAERIANPIAAIRRGFALTRGRGWGLLGLLTVIVVAGLVVTFAISAVFGSVFLLAGGQQLGGLLIRILDAILGAALGMVLVALYAAIYRRLSGEALPTGRRSSGV